jgi:hypothetical protein
MEKTAVEWFFNELYSIRKTIEFELQADAILKAFKQALEMEKQLIMSAFTKGEFFSSDYFDVCAPNKDCSENYYKETFKK